MKRRAGGWLRAIVAASLALSFLGIIEAPTASAALTQTTTTSGEIYGGDWYRLSNGYSDTNGKIECAAGSVVTSIWSSNTLAASEYYSTKLAISCTPLNASRAVSGSATKIESALGATSDVSSTCSAGKAANAIRINNIPSIATNSVGNSQWVVNSAVNCVNSTDNTSSEQVEFANTNRASSYGSRTVTTNTSSCQTGSLVVGLEYESGGGLHELRALCASFQMDQAAFAVSTTTGTYLTSLTLGTTGGSGNGSVTYAYASGSTTCTLNSDVLTANGAGTCKITATKASSTDYNQVVSIQTDITFAKAAQAITFGNLITQVRSWTQNLVASSSVGLTLTYTSSNTAICTVSGTVVTAIAVGTCTITASQAGNSNYAAATSVSRSFAVINARPDVSTSNYDLDGADTGLDVVVSAAGGETVVLTGHDLATCTTIVQAGGGWTGSLALTNVSDTSATFVVPTASNFQYWIRIDCGGQLFDIGAFLERRPAPTISVVPAISGTIASGQTLTATRGTWTNTPTSYSFQWKSSATSNGTYAIISGAINETFTLTASENGLYIKVFVTATNISGSATANSIATAQITRLSRSISITSLGTSSKAYPYSQALSISSTANGTGAKTYAISGGTATSCALSTSTSDTPTITASSSGTCGITVSIAQDATYLTATSTATYFNFVKANQLPLSITSTTGTYGSGLAVVTSGGSGTGGKTFTITSGTTTCSLTSETLTASSAGDCYLTVTRATDVNYEAETSTATLITFSRASQTLLLTSIGSTTKTYPYSRTLSITTSGFSGTGSISYSVTDVSATGCSLDDANSSTPIITATTSGTCAITASISQDANYSAATSPAINFVFSRANQGALTVTSTSGSFGTPLSLAATGGSNLSSITFSQVPGSTTCTLSNGVLTASASGTCKVTATRASDANYNSVASSEAIITFARGVATASISFPTGSFTFRETKVLTATASAAGKVTFRSNGKLIAGCNNLKATAGNSFQVSCSYKPSTHGSMKISVTFDPTNPDFIGTTTVTQTYYVLKRTVRR